MKKLLKLLALMAAAAVIFTACPDPVSEPAVNPPVDNPAETVTIWEGNVELDGSWDGAKAGTIPAENFANIAAGGKIEVFANGTAQLKINAEGWPAIPSVVPLQDPEWGNVSINGSVSFVLAEKDVDLLKASGMVLFGANITYTKVTYTPAN